MSRKTLQEQPSRQHQLNEIFTTDPTPFSHLSILTQQEIYRFYEPHKLHMLDSLRALHASLATSQPSLVNRAGKHYRKLVIIAANLHERARSVAFANRPPLSQPRYEGVITVRPLVRPEPDAHRIAPALNAMANQIRHEFDGSKLTSSDDASERRAVARSR